MGGSCNVNDYWKSKRLTRISLGLQRINYSQEVTLSGNRANLNIQRSVSQTKRLLGLDQELWDWFLVQWQHARYSYDESTSQLGLATSNRRTSWSGSQSPSYGLPDKSTSFSFLLSPLSWGETSVIFDQTTFLTTEESKSNSWTVEQVFFYQTWELSAAFTKTKFSSTNTSEDDSHQTFVALQIGYTW